MSDDDRDRLPSGRLDPFALPSETTFRFMLLVLATLAAGLFVSNWVFYSVGGDDQLSATVNICGGIVDSDLNFSKADIARLRCHDPLAHRTGLATIAGALGILGLGGLACCVAPAVRMRRRRLIPLRDDVPDAADAVAELAREAGLRRCPESVWNPLDPGTSALAFGAFGRHRVALGAGLVAACFSDRERFRAVILHELAHVRNGDVTLTYMAVWVWRAFVVAGVIPFVLTLFDEPSETVLDLGWRFSVLAALVYLSRNAVLRGREAYADARAAAWAGSPAAIKDALGTAPAPGSPWLGPVRRLTAVHPATAERSRLLDRPEGLFRLRPLDTLVAGIAAGVGFWQFSSAIGLILQGRDPDVLAPTWAALVAVPLAVGVVVAGAWRVSQAAHEGGSATRPLSPVAGLALAGGLLIGGVIAPEESIRLPGDVTISSFDLLWTGTFALLGAFFVEWTRAAAGAWLGAVRSADGARLALIASWVLGGAALAWFVGQATPQVELLEQPESPGIRAVVNFVAQKEVTLAAFLVFASFPLAAYLGGGRDRRIPVRSAAVPALVGGLSFFAIAVVWRLVAHGTVPLEERETDSFILSYAHRHEEIAVALQAAVACAVVVRGGLLATPLALLAGFVAGALSVAAFIGLISASGCVDALALSSGGECPNPIEGSFVWDTLVLWLSEGAALAALVIPLVLLGRRALARAPAGAGPSAGAARTLRAGRWAALIATPRAALPAASAASIGLALAGTIGFLALARADPPAPGSSVPAEDVPPDLGPTPELADLVGSLCADADADIRGAAGAPLEVALRAQARRVGLLARELEGVEAPPAESSAIANAVVLLGAHERNLGLATDAVLVGDPATFQRHFGAALEAGFGANRFLLEVGVPRCLAFDEF